MSFRVPPPPGGGRGVPGPPPFKAPGASPTPSPPLPSAPPALPTGAPVPPPFRLPTGGANRSATSPNSSSRPMIPGAPPSLSPRASNPSSSPPLPSRSIGSVPAPPSASSPRTVSGGAVVPAAPPAKIPGPPAAKAPSPPSSLASKPTPSHAPPAPPGAPAAPAATSAADPNGYGYGYDESGYATGYDANGYAQTGYDQQGYDQQAYDANAAAAANAGYDPSQGYDANAAAYAGYDQSQYGAGYDQSQGYDPNAAAGYDQSQYANAEYDASYANGTTESYGQPSSELSYDQSSSYDPSQYATETSQSTTTTTSSSFSVPKPPAPLKTAFSNMSVSNDPSTPLSPSQRSTSSTPTGRPSISRQTTNIPSPASQTVGPDQPPDFTHMDANQVCSAFVESEGRYVEGLTSLIKILSDHKAVKQMSTMSDSELTSINNSLAQIHHFHAGLHADLVAAQRDGTLYDVVGKIMVKRMPFFKLYTTYVKMHRETSKSYKKDKETNKHVPLRDLMMTPVSRLANYMIYLGTILEKSPDPSSPAVADLESATMATQKVTDEIAVALRDDAGRKLVATIQSKIFKDQVELISPHRFAIKQAKAYMLKDATVFSKKTGFDKVRIVLFNDCFLYGTRGGKLLSAKVQAVMLLYGMDIEDMKDAMGATQLTDAHLCFRVKTRSHKPMIIKMATIEDKNVWIQSLREAVARANETELAGGLGSQHMAADEFECKIMKKKYKKNVAAMTLKPDKSRSSIIAQPTTTSSSSYASGSATLKAPLVPDAPSIPAAPAMDVPQAPPMAPALDASYEQVPVGSPVWEQLWDDNYQAYYYSNIETGETCWEPPADWVNPNTGLVVGGAAPDAPVVGADAPVAPVAPVTPVASQGDLLSAIRGGAQLKSAAARALSPTKASEPVKPSLADALKNSLVQYRKAVQDDDDEEEDEDWD